MKSNLHRQVLNQRKSGDWKIDLMKILPVSGAYAAIPAGGGAL